MNRWLGPLAVLTSVWCSGCGTFFEIAARNLVEAPIDAASDCIRHKRLCQLAEDALRNFHDHNPEHLFSADYDLGFKDGFVDFVESGGNGEAPANPPWRYKLGRYDNLAGRQAQQDYFAGFRQGSAVARETGLRDLVVISPGQPPAPATDPSQRLQQRNQPVEAPPAEPLLPAPRLEPMGEPEAPDAQSEKKP
jgi:hypothetical protein